MKPANASNVCSVESERPQTESVNSRRGLTHHQVWIDRRAVMDSTQLTLCAYCGANKVSKKQRTFCSKSCATRARSVQARGIKCAADGCEKPGVSVGMCDVHRRRFKKNGHLNYIAPGYRVPPVERFWSRVNRQAPGGCWLWTGELQNKGYGVFHTYANGRRAKHLAHRYSLALVEPLVDGLVCLHSCDVPRCVNPAHLRQGTQLENMREARDRGRLNLEGLKLGLAARLGCHADSVSRMRQEARP